MKRLFKKSSNKREKIAVTKNGKTYEFKSFEKAVAFMLAR